MATLTAHDEDRIVFKTIPDERAPGLLLLIHGAGVAGGPLYALSHFGARGAAVWLMFVASLIVGMVEIGFALRWLLRSERLFLDLQCRTYRESRRVLFWGRSWAGSLEDLDHVRLRSLPFGRGGRHRRWLVEWVWADPGRQPFRVSYLTQLKSFRMVTKPGLDDALDFLRELRAVAVDAGQPLVVPRAILDNPSCSAALGQVEACR